MMKRLLPACLATLLIGLSASDTFAQSVGIGVGLKVGAQRFNDPLGDGNDRTRPRFEVEVNSPRFLEGYLEAFGALGFSNLERSDETLLVYDSYGNSEYLPVSEQYVTDLRLGARLYPLASATAWDRYDTPRIEPFVSAGFGYFTTTATERGAGRQVCCGEYELVEDRDTVASGLFPFVGAGVNIMFDAHWGVTLEARQDFERIDGGSDTGGPSLMVGLRFTF